MKKEKKMFTYEILKNPEILNYYFNLFSTISKINREALFVSV